MSRSSLEIQTTQPGTDSGARLPLIVIGAVLLFIGGIFTAIGGNAMLDEWRFQRDGRRAPGIVSDKTLRRATATQSTAYEISFRLSAEGEPLDGIDSVPVHVWERLERSSPVEIEYVKDEANSARLVRDRSRERNKAFGALAIGAPMLIAGLLFGGAAFRRRLPAQEPRPPNADPVTSSTAADRQSVRTILRQSSEFLAGAIFLLVGSPFLVGGIIMFYVDWQFGNEARVTEGMVLTKSIRTSGRNSNTKHYEVTYRFRLGGETFEGDGEVSQAHWESLVEREPVAVIYRPAKPSSNRLEAESRWFLKIFFTLLGALFTAIGLKLFVGSIRHASLESRLRQTGLRTAGTITSLAPLNLKINRVLQWRLEYEYRDPQGGRHVGTLDLPEPEALRWKIEDSGTVLYDASRPGVAIWVGDELPAA